MNSLLKVTILLTFAIEVIAQNSVETAFEEADLTPEVVETAPRNLLGAKGKVWGKNVDLGNELAITDTLLKPDINYDAENNTLYTLIMIGSTIAQIVTPDKGPLAQLVDPLVDDQRKVLHWLVCNIPENRISEGDVLADYLMPVPVPLTGLHPYIFLAYKQNQGAIKFDLSDLTAGIITQRLQFYLKKFVQKHNLGDPVAGNFFLTI